MMEMDGSVSYVHSTGALICVLASFLAAIVSYLALRSRRRANLRRINHGSGSTSAPLCKVCHQLVKNAPLQGDGTKEGMCSACNGCSHSAEVRNHVKNMLQSLYSFYSQKGACFGTELVMPSNCLWHAWLTNISHWILFI